MSNLTPGLSAELKITVGEADTASKWGSGLVPVYSTPAMVGLMEAAAVKALDGQLEPGQTSVGGRIDVRHLAATPLGMSVHARAELTAFNGRKLSFRVEAWDEVEKIAEGEHERFIMDVSRFMDRLAKKQAKPAP